MPKDLFVMIIRAVILQKFNLEIEEIKFQEPLKKKNVNKTLISIVAIANYLVYESEHAISKLLLKDF